MGPMAMSQAHGSLGENLLTTRQALARTLATPVQTPTKYADPVTKTSVLSNGLSVSTQTIPGMSTSTVGLWIDAGSRADASNASGTAHFLEVSWGCIARGGGQGFHDAYDGETCCITRRVLWADCKCEWWRDEPKPLKAAITTRSGVAAR